MAVKTLPGSPFEVIEAEFLFRLLMRLLANPSCLDGSSQSTQIGRSRQIGELVLPLSRHGPLPSAAARDSGAVIGTPTPDALLHAETLTRSIWDPGNSPVLRGISSLVAVHTSYRHHVPHANVCGGKGRCSTCRIRIVSDLSGLPQPSARETLSSSVQERSPFGARIALSG
jgi:ferredoxin